MEKASQEMLGSEQNDSLDGAGLQKPPQEQPRGQRKREREKSESLNSGKLVVCEQSVTCAGERGDGDVCEVSEISSDSDVV